MELILVGIVAGCIISSLINFIRNKAVDGILRIDRSNPEKDIYRLEIYQIDDLASKHKVILKVDKNADLSHQ